MSTLLRLTDPAVVRAMKALYRAGPSGQPQLWLTRRDLVQLGYAESVYDPARAYPWRVRLSPLGRDVVETLIQSPPKE